MKSLLVSLLRATAGPSLPPLDPGGRHLLGTGDDALEPRGGWREPAAVGVDPRLHTMLRQPVRRAAAQFVADEASHRPARRRARPAIVAAAAAAAAAGDAEAFPARGVDWHTWLGALPGPVAARAATADAASAAAAGAATAEEAVSASPAAVPAAPAPMEVAAPAAAAAPGGPDGDDG